MSPINKQMGEPSLPHEEPITLPLPDQKNHLATAASWILGSLLLMVVMITTVLSNLG